MTQRIFFTLSLVLCIPVLLFTPAQAKVGPPVIGDPVTYPMYVYLPMMAFD